MQPEMYCPRPAAVQAVHTYNQPRRAALLVLMAPGARKTARCSALQAVHSFDSAASLPACLLPACLLRLLTGGGVQQLAPVAAVLLCVLNIHRRQALACGQGRAEQGKEAL